MNIMGFTYDLPTPKFDLGDTVKSKSEKCSSRELMNRTYYVCGGSYLYLRDHKNNYYGKTNYYALEQDAAYSKMLLTEKVKRKIL